MAATSCLYRLALLYVFVLHVFTAAGLLGAGVSFVRSLLFDAVFRMSVIYNCLAFMISFGIFVEGRHRLGWEEWEEEWNEEWEEEEW